MKEKDCNFALEGSKTVRQPYESRLTPLFYQKTLKRARKSDVDNIGVCGNRTLSFGNQRRAPLYERQALFIRKAHQATQVLHARMLRTLSLEGSKTVRQPLGG